MKLMAITTRIKRKVTKKRIHPALLKRQDGYVEIDSAGSNVIKITRWLADVA